MTDVKVLAKGDLIDGDRGSGTDRFLAVVFVDLVVGGNHSYKLTLHNSSVIRQPQLPAYPAQHQCYYRQPQLSAYPAQQQCYYRQPQLSAYPAQQLCY